MIGGVFKMESEISKLKTMPASVFRNFVTDDIPRKALF